MTVIMQWVGWTVVERRTRGHSDGFLFGVEDSEGSVRIKGSGIAGRCSEPYISDEAS